MLIRCFPVDFIGETEGKQRPSKQAYGSGFCAHVPSFHCGKPTNTFFTLS